MTNRTELFQPEYPRLALPAATTMVFVDGVLCNDLEPVEVVRSGWPEFGWARLTCNSAAERDLPSIVPEEVEDRFAFGRGLSLHQVYNQEPPDAGIASIPWFAGQIEGIETTIRSGEERIEIVARDFSASLRRATVYGQRVLRNDGSTVLLAGLDTLFNPLGRGNAAVKSVVVEGKARTAFSTHATEARAWTCADAIHYLLSEHASDGRVSWPDIGQLLALTESRPLRDLDVTGLSLLEALHRCCDAAGVRFHFVPRLVGTGPAQAIVFHRNGRGRVIELNCQPPGESLGLSRTSIAVLHSRRTFYPITHRYIGQGDFKVYEATFELVKAWDPALEGTRYSIFSASTNPQFHNVKDVYRKWCLNEAGDYSSPPYDRGEPYDFSRLFEHAAYVPRRRRFWPALSTDAHGGSLGYVLQASFDDGLHWWHYPHAFNNLLDECGIWLSSDQLDVDTWVAALKGVLRMRLTASIVSDERLTCALADGPVGSTVPVVDHVLTLPRRFAYRKVSPQSLFAPPPATGPGTPDETDDSGALHQFVRQHAGASPAIIETTDVQTPTLRLHLHPGDRVTSCPESRDLLSGRRDSRSVMGVERVHIDFRNQCTNLRLVRQRMYEG
jgi:hypothetical protein